MKCDVCKAESEVLNGQQYLYTESGLNNVVLENIEVRRCGGCGDISPRIPRILALHATIARAVVLQQAPLRGQDIRFLRKQLGMRAKEWAVLLRIDVATFSRWENDDQNIGPQSDALIRYVYCRLSAERDERRVSEPIVNLIASVPQRAEAPAIVIDGSNVEVYKYRSMSELLDVTDGEQAAATEAVIRPVAASPTRERRERGVALPAITDDPQVRKQQSQIGARLDPTPRKASREEDRHDNDAVHDLAA